MRRLRIPAAALAALVVAGTVVAVTSGPGRAVTQAGPDGLFTPTAPALLGRSAGPVERLVVALPVHAPPGATAVAVVVTAGSTTLGRLFAHPVGSPRPTTPTAMVGPGRAQSDYAVVPLGRRSGLAVEGTVPMTLSVAVAGWYGRTGLAFTPLAPQPLPAPAGGGRPATVDLTGRLPAGTGAVALDGVGGFSTVPVDGDRVSAPAGATQLVGYFAFPGTGRDHLPTGDVFTARAAAPLPQGGDPEGLVPAAATAVVLSALGPVPPGAGPAGFASGQVAPVGSFTPVLLGAGNRVQVRAGSPAELSVTGWFQPVSTPPGRLFDRSWARPLPGGAGPGSAAGAGWAAQVAGQATGAPSVNFDGSYGYPIYLAGRTTRPATVALGPPSRCGRHADRNFARLTPPAPIPAGAAVATPAANADQPLITLQPSTTTVWELWRAEPTGRAWSACNGGALGRLGTGSGTWNGGLGLSATGISYLGTLITEADVASGAIRHVIAFTVETGRCDGHVAPATRNDSDCTDPAAPPEGTVLYLPAGLAMPGGLSPLGQMVFVALQQYGLVLTDESGGYVVAQAETSCDYVATPCRAGLDAGASPPADPIGTALGTTGLRGIPWSDLQALPAGEY